MRKPDLLRSFGIYGRHSFVYGDEERPAIEGIDSISQILHTPVISQELLTPGQPLSRLESTECDETSNRCAIRWQCVGTATSSAASRLTIYGALIEGDLDIPKHLARRVHGWRRVITAL